MKRGEGGPCSRGNQYTNTPDFDKRAGEKVKEGENIDNPIAPCNTRFLFNKKKEIFEF